MCGRYTLFGNWKASLPPDINFDELVDFQDIIDNYNVSPLQTMPIMSVSHDHLQLTTMRWGLVPAWSKEQSPQGMINARAETVSEKPSFREAFKQRRCIIPMNGFYEWASSSSGKKQPVYCSSSDDELMYAAGIWEHWISPDAARSFNAFSIITVQANALMRSFHERMPAFIPENNIKQWLFDSEHASSLLRPKPIEECKAIFVGIGVNNARMNNPDLILESEPIISSGNIVATKPPSGAENRRNSANNSDQGALF